MAGVDVELLAELRSTVELYDMDRYPIQHATARFHLGATLLGAGRAPEGADHLGRAAALFPADKMPVEHAKATNMLGIAQRDLGQLSQAGESFETAAGLFAANGHVVEEAAAQYNRGLVLRDAGHEDQAAAAFEAATASFTKADARPQAAASSRELGASLFATGRAADAIVALEAAMELARRGGDREGLGTAANVLGIVHLAVGDHAAARTAFHDAAGAHPRTVRPAEYAMARSNLALACDRAGLVDEARLAARQALVIDSAASEVRVQAEEVLARHGVDEQALFGVLVGLDQAHQIGVLRAEFGRLASDPEAVPLHAMAWVVGLAGQESGRTELAENWLDVLLEQPPELFNDVVTATVVATAEAPADGPDVDLSRRAISSAMGRFHVPQWMRLKDSFNAVAARRGEDPSWA